ncbi:MAG: serine hydrolase domain-containing protein [Gemmatimonadaceae bacterium]
MTRSLTACALLLGVTSAIGAQARPMQLAPAPAVAPAAAPVRGVGDKAELAAFMDGMMISLLNDKHVAGATVAVVKDGALVFSKGYGYADITKRVPVDPARTLFRIGSVSKLFTWTAVMQQVEAGKIDFNADVNRYLDFKIPDAFGAPVTMRHLLTHSGGFEEDSRDLFAIDAKSITPRGRWLATHIPSRVRAPGSYSAYSNYGATLAGYIVERVSGTDWDTYIEQHIMQPLGMTHTTGRQPLPASLAGDMSTGYSYAGGLFVPQKFELLAGAAPAGSISSTAADMALFMLAHLGNGAMGQTRILADSTATLMHARAFGGDARLDGWALGFYEQSSHGARIIGHGGDTQWFHSDLTLIPSDHVGLFVSFNTNTGAVLSFGPLVHAFLDHYYPTTAPVVTAPATAKAEAARVAGEYQSNRHSYTTFQKAAGLAGSQAMTALPDGSIIAGGPLGAEHYVPVGPLLYRQELGDGLLAFKADSSGRIVRAFFSDNPTDALERLSWHESPKLHLAVLGLGLLVFLGTIVAAVSRFARRRWGHPRPEDALQGRWLVVTLALANVLFAILLASLLSNPLAVLSGTPTSLKLALALPVLGALLALAGIVVAVRQWRGHTGTRAARVRYAAVLFVAVLFVWSLNQWNLLGWSM